MRSGTAQKAALTILPLLKGHLVRATKDGQKLFGVVFPEYIEQDFPVAGQGACAIWRVDIDDALSSFEQCSDDAIKIQAQRLPIPDWEFEILDEYKSFSSFDQTLDEVDSDD